MEFGESAGYMHVKLEVEVVRCRAKGRPQVTLFSSLPGFPSPGLRLEFGFANVPRLD